MKKIETTSATILKVSAKSSERFRNICVALIRVYFFYAIILSNARIEKTNTTPTYIFSHIHSEASLKLSYRDSLHENLLLQPKA